MLIQEVEFILFVSDQARSKEFFRSVLGLDPSLDVLGMTEFELGTGCKLGLLHQDSAGNILNNSLPHPRLGVGIPRAELYLYVDDVDKYFMRALGAGAKPISPGTQRGWGDYAAYVTDKDGHVIAFASREKSE